MFAGQWNRIAGELLAEEGKAWNFERGAPQGPHKAITDIETGILFAVVASDATHNKGASSRDTLWKEWAESELNVHGRSLRDLSAAQRAKTAKRVKKEIDSGIGTLRFFSLIELEAGHVYRLTKAGAKRLRQLRKPAR